jgi:flavin reductase
MTQVAGKDYRDAMACLGAAVNIVTTDGNAGRAGFAASAICSVTDDPPTLLVCMNRGSSAYASVTGNGVLCVNVLSARHERLSRLFAVSSDCSIIDVANVGTHDMLFCTVVALQRSDCADNLIYFARDYHVVRASPA